MKRTHKIRPDFIIDNITDINNDPQYSSGNKRDSLASVPLRMVIPGLSSLRTDPKRD